jgi:flagellar export protein FliJ
MKQFVWRLQRVLEIRKKEEKKKRIELLQLTEKLAATRSELLLKKKILEDIIQNLSKENTKQRIAKQELFLTYAKTNNEYIKMLNKKVHELELQQKEKIEEVLKIRKLKDGLEKLKTEAKVQYIREQENYEQKEIDEGANISFALNAHN